MKWRLIGQAAFVLLLLPWGVATAQDGLRSASLPERNLSSLRPPRPDVHLATPDTYRPHPDRVPLPVFGFQSPAFDPAVPPIIIVQMPPREAPAPAAAPAVTPPPSPYVAGVPGKPKTFYVIPGCYAGDRPPDPESLAPACNRSRLRVVPPS